MNLVDLTKAIDTVSRDKLWKIMSKYGCPSRFMAIATPFYDGVHARVQNNGEYVEPFPVTNGVE